MARWLGSGASAALRAVADDTMVVDRRGSLASIVLSRPKALNSIHLGMVRTIARAIEESAADPRVSALVMRGAGDKAFCAGGDVRAVMEAARERPNLSPGVEDASDAFFREEYALNAAIAGCPKPQVSIWDGIVMGGGAGLSVHGAFRVATERALFAMPETAIGLFPDVGASYFLSRLPGETGTFLGLTGARLGATDLLECGLATHYVPSSAVGQVEEQLQACGTAEAVGSALAALAAPPPHAEEQKVRPRLAAERAAIDECFSAPSVEAICARLEARADAWGDETLATLRKMSPTSLKVTLRLLRHARGASLARCLQAEFRACQQFMEPGSDFFEGIRAALVDKDRNPAWSPATIGEVSEASVDLYFQSLGARELVLHTPPGFSSAESKL
ncbi:hypothetical protein AB1Y20_001954 [Prymnesium parvum]|uniref:3-hydroxyisobutyryl-CoA hydrolase n=1 Tax=Prymnesium parvum TaxID=97485 RepID=A0AB34J7H7_PRYPA